MRYKILLVLHNILENNPIHLADISKLNKTLILDCYKGSQVPKTVYREACKHDAKTDKRDTSNKYIAIGISIQYDGDAIADTVNHQMKNLIKYSMDILRKIYCL